ncbi:MAG TPA: hypothetical protein PLQ00_17500, partial [Thermoguttaceae bacterium]|nr:hypothetical protein [Thermoguttaceae bacterium]
MSGVLPEWVQQMLGIRRQAGEGVQWTLEHAWPWPGWLSLLLVALLIGLIVGLYWREDRTVGRRRRLTLIGLRLLLLLLLFWMIAQTTLVLHRTGLPYLAVLIDNSGSMGATDPYETSQAQMLRRRMKEAGLPEEPLSRLNLAKMLLLENDSAWLKKLRRDYQLRIYV